MVCHALVSDNVVVSVYTDLSPRKNRLSAILVPDSSWRSCATASREAPRASNREHGFSWVFEERTSGARVLDMGKRSRKGAYKAITPFYLKVFNHWKKKNL